MQPENMAQQIVDRLYQIQQHPEIIHNPKAVSYTHLDVYKRQLEDRPLLLRSYQALVVDEAHKLPDAARQMYTETLSSRAMDELCLLFQQAHYKDFARQLRTTFLLSLIHI